MVLMGSFASKATTSLLDDGVYWDGDGSTLYIGSGVSSLGNFQVNPSVIYSYATVPPACVANTFTAYGATLHVPTSGMVNYFSAQYWYGFANLVADAVEPESVTLSKESIQVEEGKQQYLSATVLPATATPNTIIWSSTNTAVATVADGMVTATTPGECDIIAWCAGRQAVCHVTVLTERVTITLDRHIARLLPNHLLNMTATCTPTSVDLMAFSSDNTIAIPRLINGAIQVVGLKEGTATITLGSVDGTANTDSCQVTVYTEVGDVNCDGYANIADVTFLIDYLLGGDVDTFKADNADTNRDNCVNIADVTMLVDYLLGDDLWPWEYEFFTVNGVTFRMVEVEGGTFTMGATPEQGSDAWDNEKPAHQVTLSSFAIGQTEVTADLWIAVMGTNPYYFYDDLNFSVGCSWPECQMFITKLNQLTGKHFRLPTEAEWEFAARGGNKSQGFKYAGSNTIADVAATGPGLEVATKSPNELGLYDMSGNVWEWCQDRYEEGYSNISNAMMNPIGPFTGNSRVLRGGAMDCDEYPACFRVSCRMGGGSADPLYGFRIALDEDNSEKFRLSETVLEVMIGKSNEIAIINGNDNYSVTGGDNRVSCLIIGNSLIVTGQSLGITTVYLSDEMTGAQTQLVVIVNANE